MSNPSLHLIVGQLTGNAPLDTAVSRAILSQVSEGSLPETLQVGLPGRAVAFGKHDSVTSGFQEAVSIALDHGFDATIRNAGGRAIVFHPGTIRFVWTIPSADPVADMNDRFQTTSEVVVATLKSLHIESEIGELKDEYCSGTYSVHLTSGGKVTGTGQRLAKHAAQIAGMIVVTDSRSINDVLVPIYGALGLPMDPTMTGALSDVRSIHPDMVAEALITEATRGRDPILQSVSDTTMGAAAELASNHDPRILA